MEKRDVLISGWNFAYETEDWYPPLKAALSDVDFAHASWKPAGNASHTIVELVSHLLYYRRRFLFRLKKQPWDISIETNDDTFATTTITSQQHWDDSLRELHKVQQDIKSILGTLDEEGWKSLSPEAPIDRQVLSLMMHYAYHTGQIILIRKLYGSWPGEREVS